MDKMQVEKMRDFFYQKKTYEVISAWISPRIFQDHVQTMISEAVAEVQKNFYKIYFLE